MHIIIPDNLHKDGLSILDATEGVTYDAHAEMTPDELLAKIAEADGLIIRSASTVNAGMLDAAANLKAIARAGVGVDNIDLSAATERGVIAMNAPDGNTVATAELAMGLMLALSRHIPQGYATMRDGKWDKKIFMGTELRGKTLGIVGFGRIGQTVAKRAAAFDMTVIAHDPFIPQEVADPLNVRLLSLDDMLAQADYITLHTVATPETKGMINAANIAKMKDGVRIINAARGTLVNENDLAAGIKSGKVAGAAVDVYPVEPPPSDNPLVGLDGVIHTPHLGASTHEAQSDVAVQAVNNLLDALLKGEYRNVVNPAVLETT